MDARQVYAEVLSLTSWECAMIIGELRDKLEAYERTERQIAELTAAGCDVVITEGIDAISRATLTGVELSNDRWQSVQLYHGNTRADAVDAAYRAAIGDKG